MKTKNDELKKTASQLLAGMLSNPHIYSQVSDEGGYGNMEQQLIIASVEMAESLIGYIEKTHSQSEREVMSNKSNK
ncbi:hypothetical protein H6G06_25340 [Anabaena sphaerica FACHB-251]|uniref:Uncharacterized protein n=1 Tax=Anabaena sphaerica FACHB-251 TaxID=2692883 RepID=A0A926WLC8_9NOST|nr:hypothetical protein [Anabaena sphaerica]MBD2296715.1 hypothetical protein [Anabaena sphaerica FACHB-251]